MTVTNGFIAIQDAEGFYILTDWEVNSDESAGIRIDTEGEIAIWTDMVNRVNAYDANQAEIKRLRDEIHKIRPYADCYKSICSALGIEKDVLGYIERLREALEKINSGLKGELPITAYVKEIAQKALKQ